MNLYWLHFKTITRHKLYVMKACFKAGIYKQGITHDLSKYSFTEFISSAKYFQGNSSPIYKEKAAKGYSLAWQNHMGLNRHHWQYWLDFNDGVLLALQIPPKYLVEMLCDWVGAGMAYNKDKWTIKTLTNWYRDNKNKMYLHDSTKEYVDNMMNRCNKSNLYYWINVETIEKFYNTRSDKSPSIVKLSQA